MTAAAGTRTGARPEHRRGDGADGVLVATALLGALGLVMSLSATAPLALGDALPPHFLRHTLTLVLGIGLAVGLARVPLQAVYAAALPFWVLGVALLAATHVAGVEVNGAQRWLVVPGLGLRFQPVELVKLATVLSVARIATPLPRKGVLEPRRIFHAGILAGLPALLLVLQPDLGNAVLIGLLTALVLCVAGARWRHLAAGGAIAAVAAAAFVARNPYALRRLTGFLRPWETSQAEGFQLVQSFAAFGKGGLFGAALGDGRQKLFYLPEVHTDFILALVAEELGLIGVWVVLAAFATLLLLGVRIARRAPDRFSLLVAFGATALLTVPALLNAAVVMGLLPTKGLTLPFLSYGRTSLVACCAATGLLLAVARRSAAPGRVERGEAGRVRRGAAGRVRRGAAGRSRAGSGRGTTR